MSDVILELQKSDFYRIFWLKYVDDVNLQQHCMKCLLGKKSEKVSSNFRIGTIILNESDSEYFYLCGVVYPWNWSNNFHCAFRKVEGKEFTYTFRHTAIRVINAEQIEITDKWIDPFNPKAKDKFYYTCRNWQFANWFAKNCKPKTIPKNEFNQINLFD